MFSINNILRENIKNLIPYSSARDEYQGEASVFWMRMRMHLARRSMRNTTVTLTHYNTKLKSVKRNKGLACS